MANYKKTSKGFETIEISREELIEKVASYGICDQCNIPPKNGTYIGVLNQWVCDFCFDKWHKHARRYEEDIPTEKENIKFFSHLIFGSEPTGRRFVLKVISITLKQLYITGTYDITDSLEDAKIFTEEKEAYAFLDAMLKMYPNLSYNVIEL